MAVSPEAYRSYISILEEELIPAFGCTEPISLAYCAAMARDVLGKTPDRIVVEPSGNIIKNVKSVVVPNTNGLKGIEAAVATGVVAGKAESQLEVIADISDEEKKNIAEYMEKVSISVIPLDTKVKLDIIVTVYAGEECAKVRLAGHHTDIVHVEKNGEVTVEKEVASENVSEGRYEGSVEEILEFANTVNIDDVREVLSRQISYNYAIAEEGIKNPWGAQIGKTLLETSGTAVQHRARAYAAAGSDARMSGCEMPVVINSGSGNQGITVSVPVITYARELQVSEETLYRALTLSNLLAIHIKHGVGPLSAYCGAVSAGCAAGCGIAYLYGADYEGISHTLVNAIAIASGIICDGAKPSCAAKICTAVDAGIMGYRMYVSGRQFYGGDGIVLKGVENTIKNIRRLCSDGMRETDKEIIKMMTEYSTCC